MASQSLICFVLLVYHNLLLPCTSAAVHSHSLDNPERESDGSYRARDAGHYSDAGHTSEFDHEAILGSLKEAEEYDRLSPEESRQRLALLLPKMDLNGDLHVDQSELKDWIMNSFLKLSREEAEERMIEADTNRDSYVTWPEYLQDTFGVDSDEEVSPDETGDSGMLLFEEKQMWAAADTDGDNKLSLPEFEVFTNPEEHDAMHPFLIKQTLREKDKNGDGRIDFQEFIGERGTQQDKEWLIAEKDKFDHELDSNRDGELDQREIHQWVIPDNNEIALEEVDHLFSVADDDQDDLLSFEEILSHHEVFVGSEATDYGNGLMDEHFDDEL